MNNINAIVSLFLLSSFFSSAFADDDIVGIWGGLGVQNSVDGAWTIKMTISQDGYRIDYPSIPCSGELELLSSNGSEYTFREKITSDKDDKCVDNGTLIVTKLDSDTMVWKWYLPNGTKDTQTQVKKYLNLHEFNLTVPPLLTDYNRSIKHVGDDSIKITKQRPLRNK